MSQNELFCAWLDEQLERNGITGKDLALQSGVSEASISRIRNGKAALSARMRKVLATTLNVSPADIPSSHTKGRTREANAVQRIKVVPSSIPDHACLSFAAKRGLFNRYNIVAEQITDSDLCASYAEKYEHAIIEQTSKGQPVLAMGHQHAFDHMTETQTKAFYSHTYKNYALIARAKTDIVSVDQTPPHNRLFTLRIFLETLENHGLWDAPTLNRFSWKSTFDLKFLSYLKGIADEMTKGIKFEENYFEATTDKPELESLYSLGNTSTDFVLTDARNLARVYAEPELYKIVLSFEKLKNIIANISTDKPPVWSKLLMSAYRADKATVAVQRFKTFWLNKLNALEIPVYWHLLAPTDFEEDALLSLSSGVEKTLADFTQILNDPLQRDASLRDIQKYVEHRHFLNIGLYGDNALPDFEFFKRAWEESFCGL